MTVEPLTARRIADALGRGIVRGCYPPYSDEGSEQPATIVTRFDWADGDPLAIYLDPDGPYGPRLTDMGLCVSVLAELGCRPDIGLIQSTCSGGGCRYDNNDGAIWTDVDASWPEEDAAALVAVLLRLNGYAIGRVLPKAKPRPPRRNRVATR